MLNNEEPSYSLLSELNKNNIDQQYLTFIDSELTNFCTEENISKVINLSKNIDNFKKFETTKKLLIIMVLTFSPETQKYFAKVIESCDDDVIIELVKKKNSYNRVSRENKKKMLQRLIKSPWLSKSMDELGFL